MIYPGYPDREKDQIAQFKPGELMETFLDSFYSDLITLTVKIATVPVVVLLVWDHNKWRIKFSHGIERSVISANRLTNYLEPWLDRKENTTLSEKFLADFSFGEWKPQWVMLMPLRMGQSVLGHVLLFDERRRNIQEKELDMLGVVNEQLVDKLNQSSILEDWQVAFNKQVSQYRLLSENSRDIIAVYNRVGTYEYISQSIIDVLGYHPQEILGNKAHKFIHPDDWSLLDESLREMTDLRKSGTSFECRMKCKNGEYLWLEVYMKAILDPDDEVEGFHASARDISDRKKDAKNLSLLIENTTDAVWAIDKHLHFIFFNTIFQDFYFKKTKRRAQIGQSIDWNALVPDMSSRKALFLERALDGTKSTEEVKFEIEGEILVFENSASPIYDGHEEVIGVSVFSRDITERFNERTETDRYQSGLQLLNDLASESLPMADVFASALQRVSQYLGLPLGIISKVEGKRYIVKHFHSESAAFDLRKEQVLDLDKTYCQLLVSEGEVTMLENVGNSVHHKHPCYLDLKLEAYMGALVHVEGEIYGTVNFSSPVAAKRKFSDYDKQFMKLLANWIGSVLTKEKAYRFLELEKERAEEASVAKANFLSMMSHEVRTPLNGIIGTTHLLQKRNPSKDQLRHLNILQKSSAHLQTIVTDILDFAKIEEGKILLENAEFNLHELVEGIRLNYETQIEEKRIELILDYDEALSANYWGDQVRISQVLHNLMSNAIKFTEVGSITFRCKRTDKVNKFDHLLFEVEDTGIGIPPEHMESIFGVFSQADDSITRKFGGSGLGLSITKKLLELMGGEIEVESEVDAGTTFRFQLALKRGSRVKVEKPTKHEKKKHKLKGTILIVEDNLFNRVIAREFVESWGLKVLEAENGQEAIEVLQDKKVDIVLLDIQMPVMDGYEAIKWIRDQSDNYFQELPVIALTASAMVEVQDKVYRSGMNDFLTKPFVPDEFHKKLEHSLALKDRKSDEISLGYLKELLHDDQKKLKRFFDLFIESVTDDYPAFEKALLQSNIFDIQQLIKKNKSTLKSLGLISLADHSTVIERMIENDNPARMIIRESQNHLKELRSTVEQIKDIRESVS